MAEEDDADKKRIDDVINLVFRRFLNRDADEAGIATYRQAIHAGMTLETFIDSIFYSEEARALRSAKVASRIHHDTDEDAIVDLIYRAVLLRDADEGGKHHFKTAIRNGMSIPEVIRAVSDSREAADRRFLQAGFDEQDEVQDGLFIHNVVSVLSECGVARPRDFERGKPLLRGEPMNRIAVIQRLISEKIEIQEAERKGKKHWIMGTDQFLTPEAWQARVARLTPQSSTLAPLAQPEALEDRKFVHSGEFRVSAIASLYKGGKYIENFLENMVSQTIFDQSELIIVDACSPEGEGDLIRRYAEIYPNIVYKRFDLTIGIYDAWNYAASIARGNYLTNTNLDDLRRDDSFAVQAEALDENEFVDVVYQDFYYSLDHSMGFDTVAKCGFKSNLPIATPNNMLEFNSLHNAPMWRRRLHDEIGYFDVNYRSAGDYEFWLRCLKNKKEFFKINSPHVVYYCNPEGISTAAGSPGADEGNRARRRYAGDLISPYFQMSRKAFAREVGSTYLLDHTQSDYDFVHTHMRSFSAQSRAKWPGSPRSPQAIYKSEPDYDESIN